MQKKCRSATDRRPRSTEVLHLRVTRDQKEDLVAEAMKQGISLSDVARARIFQHTPSGAAA